MDFVSKSFWAARHGGEQDLADAKVIWWPDAGGGGAEFGGAGGPNSPSPWGLSLASAAFHCRWCRRPPSSPSFLCSSH